MQRMIIDTGIAVSIPNGYYGRIAPRSGLSIKNGIDVMGGFTTYLWVALLFGLLNATLGSLLKLLTLPAVILTLGLFLVVVNASILMLVSRWSDKLEVNNFWSAIFAAVVISLVTRLVSNVGKKALPL